MFSSTSSRQFSLLFSFTATNLVQNMDRAQKSTNLISKAGVVSPYSSALHGPSRAPTARTLPQVPYDLWLQCRNSIAPFKESCLVVGCRDHEADADVFRNKAQEHFRNVLDYRFELPRVKGDGSSPSAFLTANSSSSSSSVSDSRREEERWSSSTVKSQQTVEHNAPHDGSVQSLVTQYCSTSGKNGLDIVVISPACTSPIVSVADLSSHNNNNNSTNKRPKLISRPEDIFFSFETFAPLIRPHGCICLTGTDLLSSSQLVCSAGMSSIAADWRDLCTYLGEESTEDERFLTLRGVADENESSVDRGGEDVATFDEGTFQQLKQISNSFGFMNLTLFEFETEYPLDMEFKVLSGLIRKIPAYRRLIEKETVIEKNNDSINGNDDDDDDQAVSLASFSQRNSPRGNIINQESASLVRKDADPLEVFVDLAKYKMNSSTSFGGIPKLIAKQAGGRKDNSSFGDMRLKLKHWMWVCDRRPRSKDSISFVSKKK